MKAIILSSILGLSFVAASASAAVNTDQTSVWRKIQFNKTEVSVKAEVAKSQEWRIVKIGKSDDKSQGTKVWRKIQF